MSELTNAYKKYVLGSGHTHIVDPTVESKIKVEDRKIIVPNELKFIGIQKDEKAETVEFEMPRYYDLVDLSKHPLHIDYINAGGESDSYHVPEEDIEVANDVINFAWVITRNVTYFQGTVKFAIRFETVRNNIIEYSWHSEIAQFNVGIGMDVTGDIAERYPDLLQLWEARIDQTYQDIVQIKNDVEAVADSIPMDYSQLSEAVEHMKVKKVHAVLNVDEWIDHVQTLSVQGILSDEAMQYVQVIPSKNSIDEYMNCIVNIDALTNSLKFTCDEIPSTDLTLFILIMEVE